MSVDLNKCKCGDKLLTRNGTILIYVMKLDDWHTYKHLIRWPDGHRGTRTNDGLMDDEGIHDGDVVDVFNIDIEWEEI